MDEERYYLVTREDLGLYGSQSGYGSVREVTMALNDVEPDSIEGFVVLKGKELPIHANYSVVVEDE
jgi:hypothetical protein